MTVERTPQLQVTWEPRLRTWWSSLAAWRASLPLHFLDGSGPLSADPWTRGQRPVRAYSCSALIHCAVLFFVVFVPLGSLFSESKPAQAYPEIVYDLKPFNLSQYLPALRAKGPGGRPGLGNDPAHLPARGSTAFHPKLTIVSNPPRPDNFRQTIIQPNSPPDLKITQELRLPNVVLGTPMLEPKKPKQFELAGGVVRQSKETIGPASEAPRVSNDLALAPLELTNPFPRLTVELPAPAVGSLDLSTGKAIGPAGIGSPDGEGSPAGLLILGVDPGPVTGALALPPGNRYGSFSISPFGGIPGSPGGVPGGVPGGGSGGPGLGGDGSSGVGPGNSGGGGGSGAGNDAGVTISGGSGAGGMMGAWGPSGGNGGSAASIPYVPSSLVYAVRQPIRHRKGALTVTTGPIGGGGLRVYGVLKGGKIYSIYLPMPGKSWILQYCTRPETSARKAPNVRGAVAHLQPGLVPPNPQERFDFHRPPIPKDKANDLIILYGVIREDGVVAELRLHQGVEPVADQAALAAFSQWKFQPALREGKPVSLNILVGVPATVPASEDTPAGQPVANGGAE